MFINQPSIWEISSVVKWSYFIVMAIEFIIFKCYCVNIYCVVLEILDFAVKKKKCIFINPYIFVIIFILFKFTLDKENNLITNIKSIYHFFIYKENLIHILLH